MARSISAAKRSMTSAATSTCSPASCHLRSSMAFSYPRQRLHAVTSVEAWRVNVVRKPGPPRQSLITCERPLRLRQDLVERLSVRWRELAARRFELLHRLPILTRAFLEADDGILQRGKVEMRNRFLRFRWDIRFGRIGGCLVTLVANQPVLPLCCVPHVVGQRRDLINISGDCGAEPGELEGKHLGFGQAKHGAPSGLGQGDPVLERRIGEPRVMIEGIEDRVVRATPTLAAIAEVERRDPQMLQEGGVIRPGPERADAMLGLVVATRLGRVAGRGDAPTRSASSGDR